MAGIMKRLTGAGFSTGVLRGDGAKGCVGTALAENAWWTSRDDAQPATEVVVDAPVFTGALEPPAPVSTISTFKVAGHEALSADHLKTIFPMGAPECYKASGA
ncbi:unnamed protein product, partial [Prorocentrum cordatum]